MSDRIIDLTEKTTVTGSESIPGTEQTSPSDTVPANKRWTWNTIKTWILSSLSEGQETITISPGNSDTITLRSQALIAVNVSDIGVGGDENFKLKIGTTAGGSDIADLELAVSDTHGFRQVLAFSTAGTQTIYITEYSAGSSGAIQVCLETKKIYQ